MDEILWFQAFYSFFRRRNFVETEGLTMWEYRWRCRWSSLYAGEDIWSQSVSPSDDQHGSVYLYLPTKTLKLNPLLLPLNLISESVPFPDTLLNRQHRAEALKHGKSWHHLVHKIECLIGCSSKQQADRGSPLMYCPLMTSNVLHRFVVVDKWMLNNISTLHRYSMQTPVLRFTVLSLYLLDIGPCLLTPFLAFLGACYLHVTYWSFHHIFQCSQYWEAQNLTLDVKSSR